MRFTWLPPTILVACAYGGSTPSGTTLPPITTNPPSSTTMTARHAVVDTFAVTGNARVDALFVVESFDDAGQTALATWFPSWMNAFLGSPVDYHFGVITADEADAGVLREADGLRWVDADTPNPVAAFAGLAAVGTGGSTDPEPLVTAQEALDAGANPGFLRSDSFLSLIVVGSGATGGDPVADDEFVDWFRNLRPDQEALSCLITGDAGTDCGAIAPMLDGYELPADDAASYETLAEQAAGLTRTFTLSAVPDGDISSVTVTDPSGAVLTFAPETDWAFDPVRNAVVFVEYLPPVGATVTIEYLSVWPER